MLEESEAGEAGTGEADGAAIAALVDEMAGRFDCDSATTGYLGWEVA